MMGGKRRRLNNGAQLQLVEEEEPELPSRTSDGTTLPNTPAKVVSSRSSTDLAIQRGTFMLPSSFNWNPLVSIDVDKKSGNVSRFLPDFHQSRDIVRFKNNAQVDEFVSKNKDEQGGPGGQVSIPIIYSRDGFDFKGEAGTIIYPILELFGCKISCLILDANLFLLEEGYRLASILKLVPNLSYLSLKSGGDDEDEKVQQFPPLPNLKGLEIVSHFYCGLATKLLEAYGYQLTRLALQDLDKPNYCMPPGGCRDSLNRMVKALSEINGMWRNVEELKICSLRNLRVLSSVAGGLSRSRWKLKRLAVNVTIPDEQLNFSHFQVILNRFCGSLEEVHLDVFGFHQFVEAFYDWEGKGGPTRRVCSNLRVLSLPCLVLVRHKVLGEVLSKCFPNLEQLTFLRWERLWPMKVAHYLGRPWKKELARVVSEIKIGLPELKEVKVLREVNTEDVVWSKDFGKRKQRSQRVIAKERGGKTKRKL